MVVLVMDSIVNTQQLEEIATTLKKMEETLTHTHKPA
jgi:hypothetical protein